MWKTRSKIWEYQEDICNMYKNRFTMKEIAEKYSTTTNMVFWILKENEIKTNAYKIYDIEKIKKDYIDWMRMWELQKVNRISYWIAKALLSKEWVWKERRENISTYKPSLKSRPKKILKSEDVIKKINHSLDRNIKDTTILIKNAYKLYMQDRNTVVEYESLRHLIWQYGDQQATYNQVRNWFKKYQAIITGEVTSA